MSPFHAFLLHAAFVAFSLVILAFLAFVPFYRTFTGWILFSVKVNFWLILLLAVSLYHGLEQEGLAAEVIRSILYPLTTATGVALFVVILRAQVANRRDRRDRRDRRNRRDRRSGSDRRSGVDRRGGGLEAVFVRKASAAHE